MCIPTNLLLQTPCLFYHTPNLYGIHDLHLVSEPVRGNWTFSKLLCTLELEARSAGKPQFNFDKHHIPSLAALRTGAYVLADQVNVAASELHILSLWSYYSMK